MIQSMTLSVAIVFAFACLLGLFAATSYRSGVRALGDWLVAWACHIAASGFVMIAVDAPIVQPVAYLFSSLVAPIMLIGAFSYVGRPSFKWLPLFGLGIGITRALSGELISHEIASFIAAIVEPPLAVYAGYLVLRSEDAGSRTLRNAVLALGFLSYGAVELLDALVPLTWESRWTVWGGWIVLGMPLFATQIALSIRRLGLLGDSAKSLEITAASQETRIRILTESNDSIVVEYDQFGTLTYVSRNAETLMGQSVDAVIGNNAGDYFDTPQDSSIKRALDEKGYIGESDVLTASSSTQVARLGNGDVYYYEASRTTYYTADGELRILSQARDVTERILREEVIHESERRLNRAERAGSFGSWEFVFADSTTYWSAHLYRMHGLEPATGPIDREQIRGLMEQSDLTNMIDDTLSRIEGDRFPEYEFRIRRADNGALRTLRTVGEVEYDDDGELLRITGASIDVTDQYELEAALQRGREHLDTFVSSNIVGVFYADIDNQIVDANEAFLSALGLDRTDLPLDWVDLTSPSSHARDEIALRDLIETGTALPHEKEFLSVDGETVPMLVGCAKLSPEYGIVLALDISERKRAESYIANQQRQLENTIAERTTELLQSRQRLHEAQRLATIGTLAAGVAHQINNPIGAILNSAEYALLCDEDKDAVRVFREALERNLSEAQRCAQIVKSMLQFSRDEPTEKWTDDLNRIVQHSYRAIQAYAKDCNAKVEIKPAGEVIKARVSPIEIEQAVVNILRNAIESRTRGAHVTLSLGRRGETAQIEIVDDGRGIAPEVEDHLFDPFFSTRTRHGGTGLGLSVAHGIAKDHGGDIRVDSVLGKGTRVVISLPIDN